MDMKKPGPAPGFFMVFTAEREGRTGSLDAGGDRPYSGQTVCRRDDMEPG